MEGLGIEITNVITNSGQSIKKTLRINVVASGPNKEVAKVLLLRSASLHTDRPQVALLNLSSTREPLIMPPSSSKIGPSTRVSLHSLLDANSMGSSSASSSPIIDLNWEPFEANIKTFLSAVSVLAFRELQVRHGLHSLRLRMTKVSRADAGLLQIDTYTQRARTELASETRSHVDRVKTLKGHKEMIERSVQMEGERERDMLTGQLSGL